MDVMNNTQLLTDAELAERLGAFQSKSILVNEITLHYVEGGKGETLVLLPGWPETWWSYRKIMPELAKSFRVISVDIRGMGASSKPKEGYRKKDIAADIAEMVKTLQLGKIHIAGHDIGAGVAFSFAAVYPELTQSLIILDTPPVDESIYKLPMMPVPGMFYPWWLAFNQVKQLPEQLLRGRISYLMDFVFDGLLMDTNAVNQFDRSVYARSYNEAEGIRASNGWYQAFPSDIEDNKLYGKLKLPVLGIGGTGFQMIESSLPNLATNLTLRQIEKCGHFLQSEKPDDVVRLIMNFCKRINPQFPE